jgi:hypothetical protein
MDGLRALYGALGSENSLKWALIRLDKVQDALVACWMVLAAISAVFRG